GKNGPLKSRAIHPVLGESRAEPFPAGYVTVPLESIFPSIDDYVALWRLSERCHCTEPPCQHVEYPVRGLILSRSYGYVAPEEKKPAPVPTLKEITEVIGLHRWSDNHNRSEEHTSEL